MCEPCRHFGFKGDLRNGVRPSLPPPPSHITQPARFEEVIDPGGLTNVGVRLHAEGRFRIGTMVAGNSGRPAGACGYPDGTIRSLHAEHSTQEEDVVSNWMHSTCFNSGAEVAADGRHAYADTIYASTICGQWGMLEPEGDSTQTVQKVDYTRAKQGSYYADAWVVDGTSLSAKATAPNGSRFFDHTQQYPTALVFVAGPNCGQLPKRPSSTMRRTFNGYMVEDYGLFREGVKAALYAGLLALAHTGCDVALLAHVSAGIYAGPWKDHLWRDFEAIVNELLSEECGTPSGPVPLGRFFDKVCLTKLK